MVLEYASLKLKADKEVVLAAVTQNGMALHYASMGLRADRDVMLAAVTQYGKALKYASKGLRADREVVLAAVTQYGLALHYVPMELRDREVVLAAVTEYGHALQYASEELQRNIEVVLAAVTQNGMALQYASRELQGDREVVLAAVAQNGLPLEYASEGLQGDREVVLTAVIQTPLAIQYASSELKDEIKQFSGGAQALLTDYETADISFVTLGGDEYLIENGIQKFVSIYDIKKWLRSDNKFLYGHFNIIDKKTSTRITSIPQLRAALFKFEIYEAPIFLIEFIGEFIGDDEQPNRSRSLQLPNSSKYDLPRRYHSSQ